MIYRGIIMATSTGAITKRRAIRAVEHKRDSLLIKAEQVKTDLVKTRAELIRVKNVK